MPVTSILVYTNRYKCFNVLMCEDRVLGVPAEDDANATIMCLGFRIYDLVMF